MFETYKKYYDYGVWNERKVHEAVEKGKLTPEEYEKITGKVY